MMVPGSESQQPDGSLAPVDCAKPDALEANPSIVSPAAVYVARLAPGSRRTMVAALNVVAQLVGGPDARAWTLAWAQLRYEHTQLVRTYLAERYAPAMANKALAALRGTLREAWRLGAMTAEEFQRAADLAVVRGETLPKGRALTSGELRALFEACVSTAGQAGMRDAAMLALAYGGGLRRAEIVALDLDDCDIATGAIRVRAGKGRKDRNIFATNGALEALKAWLDVRGTADGPLLLPINKAGRIVFRRLTDQSVRLILARRAKQAGVQPFTPHDCRRTFVGDLLDAGADISVVQAMAGHSSPNTTARYDRRGDRTKKRAAELLHVPFRRRE